MALPRKAKIVLAVLALLALVAAWQYLSFLFHYGYSNGTRTGVLRKVSVKGPPYCKYLEGELALQGGNMGQPTEVFKFSVDNHSDDQLVVQGLHAAERDGTRVTLTYRQDRPMWWRCNPSEYFITKVEK
jgi:hypothetical protein